MKLTDERLMAYADGELSADESARVEAAMAADPAIAAEVARHRALRQVLAEAYAPRLDEPVPDRLLHLLREPSVPAANVVPLAPRRETRSPSRWALPEWSAMAAALVLGIGLSRFLLVPAAPLLQTGDEGGLVAGRGLAERLERGLSSDAADGGVAIGISFRSAEGAYCRTFVAEAAQPLAGLACRRGEGRWQVPVAQEITRDAGGELQQAASALPMAVLSELDARIEGEPLDAAQEQAARDGGWR